MIFSNPNRKASTCRFYPDTLALGLTIGACVWTAGIFVFPIAMHFGILPAPAFISRLIYSPVCHQDPARSFFIFGLPLSVCARCTAIYISFAVLMVVFMAAHIKTIPYARYSLLLLLPMLLDVGLDISALSDSTLASRISTGTMAGIGLAVFLANALISKNRNSITISEHIK
jgi:uncharacterized membrane protein